MIRESRFFDIRKGEAFPLFMAALGTFSSVASVVLGRTLSDAILLSARPEINVANFFILSSLALMCVSLIYFQLLRVVSATKLNLAFLVLSALGAVAFRFVHFTGHAAILSYATFLITAPALGNIIVWSAIGDAFDARQGRRLFNLVCAASTLGGIAAGCVIPSMIHGFGIAALPIADCLTFCIMTIPVIGLRLRRRQEKTQFSVTSEGKRRLRDDFLYAARDIIRSPLLKNLSFIFFLTALATNIIDFVLKQYLQTNYDREGIAIFYGHFNAVSNTFNLIVQLTLLSQFLTRFKTRTLFALTPAVLLVFTAPFVFVYSAFCVVALRFVDVAMRFTVQDSAREIAISSLPRLLRNRAKVVFKGVMNPLGGMSAGLLLNLVVPYMSYKYTPLLLIPVIGVTMYFVRDLNRFSVDHLFKQLKLGSGSDDGRTLSASLAVTSPSDGPISYDPNMLMDDSPMVREATLDAILIARSEDIKTHSNIQRCAMACVAHEVRLAQASLVVLQNLNDFGEVGESAEENAESEQNAELDAVPSDERSDDKSGFKLVEDIDALQSLYDAAIYRIFKALMAVYRRDMIQTIFQSLSSARASTRAQALELLQLTLTNTPYAKRILIFCDDFNVEEKVIRLDELEHMPIDDALAIMGEENDRLIKKLVGRVESLKIRNR